MKLTRLAVLPAAALLVLLAGCASPGNAGGGATSSTGLTTVTIGISPFQDTYLPYIGQEKGWFKKAGLDVTLKSVAWDSVMTSLSAGSLDMAVENTTGVVGVANTASDVTYAYGFNPFTNGSALMIRPTGSLKSLDQLKGSGDSEKKARTAAIEQLRGKTIITTEGTDMGKAVDLALESVGMTERDVKIVDMDTDAGLAAFLSGTGDAYIGGVPERAKALSEGMKVMLSGTQLAPAPINGLVTTKAFISKNEPAVLKTINVLQRIIRYCDAKTTECGSTIVNKLNSATAAGLTLAGFKQYWQKIELYAGNAKQAKSMILDKSGIAYWKKTWDSDNSYLVETKAIPRAVSAKDHFSMKKIWKDYVAKYGENETGY